MLAWPAPLLILLTWLIASLASSSANLTDLSDCKLGQLPGLLGQVEGQEPGGDVLKLGHPVHHPTVSAYHKKLIFALSSSKTNVVEQNKLNLDPDPEFWPNSNLDPRIPVIRYRYIINFERKI